MGEVTVYINKKPYVVGCANGQERRVEELARQFSTYIDMVVADVGTITDVRLFLMGALLMSDEMLELKTQLDEARATHSRANAGAFEIERKASFALSDAAARLEKLAEELYYSGDPAIDAKSQTS